MLRPSGFRLHYFTASHQVITVQRSLLCKSHPYKRRQVVFTSCLLSGQRLYPVCAKECHEGWVRNKTGRDLNPWCCALCLENHNYPRKCNVNINVFRLLKQWLVIKHTVVLLYTLHTNKVAIETGFPCIPTI